MGIFRLIGLPAFGLVMLLSSCAVSGPIRLRSASSPNFSAETPLRPHSFAEQDIYRVYYQAATGFESIGSCRAIAEQRAREFAANQGRQLFILGTQTSHPPFIWGNFPRIEIIFALGRGGDGAPGSYQGGLSRFQGTGFAVSVDGLVLTAFHVIEGAERIRVAFEDGREFEARVEAASQSSDLALLKVDAADLSPLPLASAKSTYVGQELFTVGYPATEVLGQEAKYANGVLSSRSGYNGEASLMQISIPIQPGNSGGPVMNHEGLVVGVVTSSAAVGAFYRATGSLPQNVNWATKADYGILLFESAGSSGDAETLQAAIERAFGAICIVRAWKNAR